MSFISSEKSAASRRLSLLPGFFLLLLFGASAGWLVWDYASEANLSRQYHQAPGCFQNGPVDSSLPPCRKATLRVTRQWEVVKSRGPDDENLDLTEPGGRAWTESVSYDVWKAAPVGSRVSANIWKGQIVRVWAGARSSVTDDNPGYQARQSLFLLGKLGFVLLLGAGILPAALANWFRRVRGLPVSPENVYAVRAQGDRWTLSDRRYTHLGSLLLGVLLLGGIAFLVYGLASIVHGLANLSWPVLAAAWGALALIAGLGRRSRYLALRLPYLLLLLPVLLGRTPLSQLGDTGRILLFGDRWTFDRARDRVLHNDRPAADLRDIASVQLKESKSARGVVRRSLWLAAKDGAEIGAGLASWADAEETEYVAQRLADFLNLPLQRLPRKNSEADSEQTEQQSSVVSSTDAQRREVFYTSTFADFWRTNLCFTRRRPWLALYNLLALPVIGAYFWLPPYLHRGDYLGAAGLVALLLAGSVALVAALTALFIGLILARRGANPGSRFVIGADGFEDVMPEKTTAVPWREVTAVEEQGGDLYLFRRKAKSTIGTFLPRSAFAGRPEARAFYDTTLALWEKGKSSGDTPAV